jgi:D-arabinose 1-dehydrogenase-like Zn-dependent alcohol dehydrogenase
MRAAVLTEPGRLQVQNVDRLEPKAGQVRIRLEGCGVCASNLVPWAGPRRARSATSGGRMA